MDNIELTEFDKKKIERALINNGKIQAIKIYREITGQGLKDAKDYVDAFARELSDEHPELAAASKSGCSSAVLFFTATILSAIYCCF